MSVSHIYLEDKNLIKKMGEGFGLSTGSMAIIQEVVGWLEYNDEQDEVGEFLMALNFYAIMMKVEVSWREMLNALEYLRNFDWNKTANEFMRIVKGTIQK